MPILADNRTVESTLQTLAWDCALYYDTTDAADHWKSNIPSRTPGFTTIDRTVGFWVHSLSADTFITAGQVPSSTAIPLSVGWNLVGYPALSQLSISEALAGTGYDLPVEKCNTAAPGLLEQLPDTYLMAPGEGYWVHVPANMLWIVDW